MHPQQVESHARTANLAAVASLQQDVATLLYCRHSHDMMDSFKPDALARYAPALKGLKALPKLGIAEIHMLWLHDDKQIDL